MISLDKGEALDLESHPLLQLEWLYRYFRDILKSWELHLSVTNFMLPEHFHKLCFKQSYALCGSSAPYLISFSFPAPLFCQMLSQTLYLVSSTSVQLSSEPTISFLPHGLKQAAGLILNFIAHSPFGDCHYIPISQEKGHRPSFLRASGD